VDGGIVILLYPDGSARPLDGVKEEARRAE